MIVIRPASPADARRIAEVNAASWKAAHAGIVPENAWDAVDVETNAVRNERQLAAGIVEIFVTETDGRVVGYVDYCRCRDEDLDPEKSFEIAALYVIPERWRHGIGRKLCGHLFHLLEARGVESVVLWVLAESVAARRFYEAMGFSADGSSKSIMLGIPLQTLRYRRELPQTSLTNANLGR